MKLRVRGIQSWFLRIGNTTNITRSSCSAKTYSQYTGSALDGSITPSQLSTFTTPEIIGHFKYPVETHEVKTDDGFTLVFHRIPTGKVSSPHSKRGVVLLWHGYAGSSGMWFANLEHNILAFLLADSGFDVWLGNTRGNAYSRKHDKWNSYEMLYWNFSLHELGKYDAPASIYYILKNTGKTQLSYIGHSTGATQFFIMNAIYPEYSEKIRLMIALAPAVYMRHSKGLFGRIGASAKLPTDPKGLGSIEYGELVPQSLWSFLISGFNTLCTTRTPWAEALCRKLVEPIIGPSDQSLITHFPALFSMFSHPPSYRVLTHFIQWKREGIFNGYDFGAEENMARYNSTTPPLYDLRHTATPGVIFYGPTDILTVPKDVQRVANELPNLVQILPVNNAQFNHGDFLYARDLGVLVNQPILQLISRYSN